MNPILHVGATYAALFSIAALPAQAVSVSLSALTPLSVQVMSGAQTAQASSPAGALPPEVNVTAVAAPAFASVAWSSYSTPNVAFVQLRNWVSSNLGGPSASGVAGPHEILVQFTATAATSAALQMSRSSGMTAGMPWPTVAIDLGNDGSIDVPNLQALTTAPVSLGTQPTLVRVILASSMPSNGTSFTNVEFTLIPENHLVLTQTALGCAPPSLDYELWVWPTFSNSGVALDTPAQDPIVVVLGLSQQPFLLPGSGLPLCLVVPSPDVLMLPWSLTGTTISLPAAVRPVTLQAQAVGISASGLLTTDAFSIFAF